MDEEQKREVEPYLYLIHDEPGDQESELIEAIETWQEMIIIEPPLLAEKYIKRIRAGNIIYGISFSSGVASVAASILWSEDFHVSLSLFGICVLTLGMYRKNFFMPITSINYQVQKSTILYKDMMEYPFYKFPYGDRQPVVLRFKDNLQNFNMLCHSATFSLLFIAYRAFKFLHLNQFRFF